MTLRYGSYSDQGFKSKTFCIIIALLIIESHQNAQTKSVSCFQLHKGQYHS